MEVGLQIEGPRIMPLEQETDMSDFNFLLAWIDVAVPSGLIICASILSMHKIFFHYHFYEKSQQKLGVSDHYFIHSKYFHKISLKKFVIISQFQNFKSNLNLTYF